MVDVKTGVGDAGDGSRDAKASTVCAQSGAQRGERSFELYSTHYG